MPITLRSVLFSFKKARSYLAEVLLSLLSGYGFWRGAQELFSANEYPQFEPLFFLVFLGVVPLTIVVLIIVLNASEKVRVLSSEGFQHRIDELQRRMNGQDDFFQMINKNTSSTLEIYDNNNEYWYVNASAARKLGVSETFIVGKKVIEVMGLDQGSKVLKNLDIVKQSGLPFEATEHFTESGGGIAYIQTSYRPLAPFGEFPGGIMAWGDNVTTSMIERERRESMLRQIISTLVAVVDRRDPYAAGHSSHVGQLSRALAVEMNLSDANIEAAEIAGSLMNFGKVMISRSILTKTESLTPEELQRIRDGILMSADILSLIDFSVPVVPSLRQVLEHFDGTGAPHGLKGEAILPTAQIVAVANAFVALVSPRAYRPDLDFSVAMQRLLKDSGTIFAPRVINALEKVLDRKSSEFTWLAKRQYH